MTLAYDPFRPDWRDDPYPAYRELRDLAPAHYAPEAGVWCVSRYDDALRVLKTPDVFSSRAMFTMLLNQGNEGMPPISWRLIRFMARMVVRTRLNPFEFATARNLIAEDGDRHTGMRGIVNRGFTPRHIAALEERAAEIVRGCMQKLRAGDAFDVVRDLAIPLPVTLISELLGIEPERRLDFKRWSDEIIYYSAGPGREDPFNPRFTGSLLDLTCYVQDIARRRRRNPEGDLISTIVAEQEGDAALTDREVVQFVALLLVAGNETTTNLIGNATTALFEHPEALARLAADPSLVPVLVDEVLRYDAPIQLVFRKTMQDVQIADTPIPKDATIAVMIGSANRDERRFPDPDRLDLDRDTRGHLGFGFGKHFCLGASLARLEARVALEALVPLLPRLRRTQQKRSLVDSFLVRGAERLELRAA